MHTKKLDLAPQGTFTVVALPDMQSYAYRTTDVYRRVTRWIAGNRHSQRIIFVSHLGDAVDKPDDRDQWEVFREAMRELDGIVPYGIALGNSDYSYASRDLIGAHPDFFFQLEWRVG